MSILPNILHTDRQAQPGLVTVTGKCPFCANPWAVYDVPIGGFQQWRHGEHIQVALPSLSPQQREYLISGVCADCWSKM